MPAHMLRAHVYAHVYPLIYRPDQARIYAHAYTNSYTDVNTHGNPVLYPAAEHTFHNAAYEQKRVKKSSPRSEAAFTVAAASPGGVPSAQT